MAGCVGSTQYSALWPVAGLLLVELHNYANRLTAAFPYVRDANELINVI